MNINKNHLTTLLTSLCFFIITSLLSSCAAPSIKRTSQNLGAAASFTKQSIVDFPGHFTTAMSATAGEVKNQSVATGRTLRRLPIILGPGDPSSVFRMVGEQVQESRDNAGKNINLIGELLLGAE